ncbi:hypothetical protein CRG98_042386 [Punica granatum]|uniref:Uncharacterized protein n=1 Tax=Punica granatum TaxID=22663 RepID=A0A2I0HZT6_PUNGR|nr:hypothetical protein CRG98_042386 [Punica granatum]
MEEERAQTNGLADHEDQQPVYRGLKVMPFIIGNETFEKLGTIGTLSNLTVYLTEVFNMKNVSAATLINVFNGTSNMAPLVGAYLSDTYFGRFKTLGFASVSSLLFDPSTESGQRGVDSFFNWYYFTLTFALMVSATLIVYVQSNVSWSIGFAIPTGLMLLSCVLLFLGSGLYVKVRPDGSPLTSLAQVLVAAVRKRQLTVPDQSTVSLFNHVSKKSTNSKLPYTDQFRFLDKSAVLMPALQLDRRLSRSTDFKIPAASYTVFTSLSLTLWVPVYDRILVPGLRRVTGKEGGITVLQRIGVGLVLSFLSMIVAGLVEERRRSDALTKPSLGVASKGGAISSMSGFWLVPQLAIGGLSEAFILIGLVEFYYKQFPENMRSIAGAFSSTANALSSYLSGYKGDSSGGIVELALEEAGGGPEKQSV